MASGQESDMPKKKKMNRALKVVLVILIILLAAACISLATFFALKQNGKNSLGKKDSDIPTLPVKETAEESDPVIPEGAIYHEGKYYTYNEDIVTILMLGIDNSKEFETKEYGGVDSRADTIFLLSLDTKNHKMNLIPISRDTMTDVDIYSESKKYVGTDKLQLALAYTYGNGADKSCELMMKAVKGLFYGIPIHGYAAINLGAIDPLNDMIGGVEVNVLDDLTQEDPALQKGTEVNLQGSQAQMYIRARTGVGDGTNDSRMARQKQYIMGFIGKARTAISKDLSIVFNMYQTVSRNMVTNISVDEATYLATVALDCQFKDDYIYNLPGENLQGTTYMEYHPNQEALYQLVLDVFYNEVK